MKKLSAALGCTLLLASLTGCAGGYGSTPPDEPDTQSEGVEVTNTDPREGWVVVQERTGNGLEEGAIKKKCDGTTLLYVLFGYYVDGFTASPDSPECQPDPQ